MSDDEFTRNAYAQEDLERAVERVGGGWRGVEELVALAGARLTRRSFLQLASAGAVGLAACSSRPSREILPYANQPELSPGVPMHYATALVEDGFATGVLVASSEGRPTKIEGNPDHPASLGGTRAIEQAAVLSLFDPERARSITDRGVPAAWSAIEAVLDSAAGLYLVLEPTTSPLVVELIRRVRAAGAQVAFWSPFAPRASLDGNRLAFGRPLQTQLELGAAEVVVALDADLAAGHPMSPAYARQLADRRRVAGAHSTMSRLYVAEPGYSPTGVLADHRLAVRGSQLERVARELFAAVVGHAGMRGAATELPAAARARLASAPTAAERAPWIAAAAADLVAAAGRSAVVAGEHQPPVVHAIAAALNAVLGNRAVSYTEPVAFEAGQPSHDLAAVARAIEAGEVKTLIVCGGNPAYTAPASVAMTAALRKVDRSIYLGLYDNETARACRFVVPALHELEQWGAARSFDGTLTPIQPLIEPLFAGRTVDDLLHRLLGDPDRPARQRLVDGFGAPLDAALRRGCVAGSAAPGVAVEVAWGALAPVIAAAGSREPARLELALRPHPFVHDGRYTNNPWLLELPEPITKLTWTNAAQLSPVTAAALGVADGDLVRLAVRGAGAIELPAIVVPGLADGAVIVHAGFGRDGGEHTARGLGGNAFALWPAVHERHPEVSIDPRGTRRALAITQPWTSMEDRPVALGGELAALGQLGGELAAHRGGQPSLYARRPGEGPQWAMSIDLTTCTGCSACVMACAAENNTPVVGEQQVRNGREMHWLRIDRYYSGHGGDGHVAVQPMACQHCEQAPCEYVCPVEATSHSPDGLNEMTYNRCVGTRFCSNNCPYKVRRFNWFDFKEHGGLRIAARNPDVTVRDRGVMEKCTYCVQRIRRAEIASRTTDARATDFQTACQQVCPTQAITFGSLTEPGSSVAEHRHRPHRYAVLHDQGTQPRTQYLARIRNRREGLS